MKHFFPDGSILWQDTHAHILGNLQNTILLYTFWKNDAHFYSPVPMTKH